jgi:hypothetical protein
MKLSNIRPWRRNQESRDVNEKARIVLSALITMLAIVGCANSAEGFFKAGEILSNCESKSVNSQNACKMFLAGVIVTTYAWNRAGELQKMICAPADVGIEKLKGIFIKYVKKKQK